MFEEHALCLEPHALNNVRCICCHLRSIALRVNRAKIKVNLKRLEISSYLDQYQSSKQEFSFMMSETFELLNF